MRNLYEKLDLSDLDFNNWLRDIGLLPKPPQCHRCRRQMRLNTSGSKWICHTRSCRQGSTKPTVGLKKASFFRSSLNPKIVFALSYFWIKEYGRVADLSYELGITSKTVVQWHQFFRDIPAMHYRRNRIRIGGVGITVQIDETLVTRRKYDRGRVIRSHQWLFGGIEVGSGRAFLKLVRRRDAQTLERIICRYILPGTTIMSDAWRAYSNLTSLPMFYRHLVVNHSLNFIDPTTGAHTQNIETCWQKLKMMAKRRYGINNKRYTDYLCEFLWRREFGDQDGLFLKFWDTVAMFYPC